MKSILNIKLDKWQEEVLATKGNICLRSGRQVGKSTVIAIKAAKYALEHENKTIMVIAKVERQAQLLFSKILRNIHDINKKAIKKGKDKPTKKVIKLINGTIIYCLPAGETGYGLMGFTIDLFIADEAAFIPDEVFNSVIPALATTRGTIWLLSTPFTKSGYFYECFTDPTFTTFHTSTEDCPRRDKQFLEHKKRTLTKAQYAQMYLGEFVDEIKQFFPNELIKKACVLKRRKQIKKRGNYYLGCDVARMDRDEFTFEIIEKINNEHLEHVESIVTKNVPIPQSVRRIIALNKQYNFRKEYIDSGGMGIAVCDLLREDDENKRKVVEINNASRSYDAEGHQKRIIKPDLYNNLKRMLETGILKLLDDDDVKASLRSIQAEHNSETGMLQISGNYSHIAEGLVRAAWCMKDKSLNIWMSYF